MLRTLHPLLLVLSTLLVVLMHGCMVGPDYKKPDLVTNDSWHSSLMAGLEQDKDGPGIWWKEFNDPILDTLIQRAQASNLDLRTLMTRVEFARAEYGIEESFLLPSVGANGYAVWYRADQGIAPVPGVLDPTGDIYELDLAFSWEIDVWGRVRRQAQAAQQDFLAEIENWRDLLISLRAGVADCYIRYRAYRRTVELHEIAVAAATLGLDLSNQAYENGALDLRVVLDNSSTLNTLQAAVYEWEARAQNELNQISVLLGETPGEIQELVGTGGQIPVPPSTLGVAVPAEVIRQRPDVRAAERTLASAVATLGVAEAELLPQFTLSGSVGFQSDGGTSLLSWSNRAWNIGPSVSWSLLNWGRVQDQISGQKAVVQSQLLGYESTILKAYQEVEDSLVNFASSEMSRRNFQSARDDSLQSLMLSSTAYESGVEDVQSVIASELQFIQMEFQLTEQESAVAMAAVALYKSTGGDWSPVMPSADGPVPIKSKTSQSVADANSGGTS